MSASSVTTSVPTGAISEWCVQQRTPRSQLFGTGCPEPGRNGSAVDFQSICCDGVIVNTAFDMYNALPPVPYVLPLATDENGARPVDLADLVCCGVAGTQSAALDPWPSPKTACAPNARPTPLLSLAASAASDASVFAVTYAPTPPATAADESATVTNDIWGVGSPTYGASGTPVCFWANTASGVDGLAEVTVPATYVAPTTTSPNTYSGPVASTSVPSTGFSLARARWTNHGWAVTFGLVIISLLLS
ncbi:hypothetical protein F4818DRAFT_433958 [Hypoxylon cercidicola]|nr:hypothetical protein F4818DRAFT_433958 [Hypoxylon cercidicola]